MSPIASGVYAYMCDDMVETAIRAHVDVLESVQGRARVQRKRARRVGGSSAVPCICGV